MSDEIKESDGKELAIDNEMIRKINTEKVVNCIDSANVFLKEQYKNARIGKWYLLGMLLIILFFIGGAIVALAWASGGPTAFLDNFFYTDNVNKRIICSTENNNNMSLRMTQEAYYFINSFPNSHCHIIDKYGGDLE